MKPARFFKEKRRHLYLVPPPEGDQVSLKEAARRLGISPEICRRLSKFLNWPESEVGLYEWEKILESIGL